MANKNHGYSFDISKYNVVISQFHFGKFHVFVNHDFSVPVEACFSNTPTSYRKEIPEKIHQAHRVHLFYSRSNPSIGDGQLLKFIERCRDVCQRKVVIHVPKRHPELRNEIDRALRGCTNYYMQFEKNSHVTFFDWAFGLPGGNKGYLYVAWLMENQIHVGFCDKSGNSWTDY